MNEMLELWSLPWHALQRNLADRFSIDAPPIVAGIPLQLNGGAASNSPSWMARARAHARRAQITPMARRGL